ncbi:hypothetical protein D3C87_18010 [compost metagenome]
MKYSFYFLILLLFSACTDNTEISEKMIEANHSIDENLALVDSINETENKLSVDGPIPADQYSINKTNKFIYLARYNDEQDSIWLLLKAKTIEDIKAKYPELTVYEDRPDWMSRSEKMEYVRNCMKKQFIWDIDKKPTGWLKEFAGKK